MDKNYELEFLRLENEKLKLQLEQSNGMNESDIMVLINLASDMREVLELCRKQALPISLAKQIDNILNQAKNFD